MRALYHLTDQAKSGISIAGLHVGSSILALKPSMGAMDSDAGGLS